MNTRTTLTLALAVLGAAGIVWAEASKTPVESQIVGAKLIDMGTGMYVVIGVLDALRHRDMTGEGARIDFNLFETALSWMSQLIARYSQTGCVQPRSGSALPQFSPYQVFEGRDGPMFIGASTQRFWLKLVDALELEGARDDPRFTDMPARIENRDALTAIIEARSHYMHYFADKLEKEGYNVVALHGDLTQAQRDYFGAHTYERIDRPRGEFFHTNWTGRGGTTASSSYTA